MLVVLRKLSLGVGLVICCSVLLLGWDYLEHRARRSRPRVAILQQSSTPVLDDCVKGMIEGLEASGFKNGESLDLQLYNAENDNSMANAIARQITDGSFDLVMTSSTVSLQIVGTANSGGRVKHVFAAVADPYVAGVGLNRKDPLDHPKHLVGYGTLLPVDSSFELAKRLYPALNKIGVAHNPAEANSRVFMTMAREACKKLNLELVDAPVESSIRQKRRFGRCPRRRAIWVGGDVTVSSSLDIVVRRQARAHSCIFNLARKATRSRLAVRYRSRFRAGGQTGG